LQRSIKIKISKKRSINIISDMVAFKPVNERLCSDVKQIVRPKHCLSKVTPVKMPLFQISRMPPEAPSDSIKSNLSNLLGANL